jgi:transposase
VAARCRAAKRAARHTLGGEGPPKTLRIAPEEVGLTEEQWALLRPLLAPQRGGIGRPPNDHRRVQGGILWVARTGSSWREMPEEYGKWETAYRRHELRRREASRSYLAGGWLSAPTLDRPQPQDELRDYERLTETSDAFIYVAMSRLMVKRLVRSRGFSDEPHASTAYSTTPRARPKTVSGPLLPPWASKRSSSSISPRI